MAFYNAVYGIESGRFKNVLVIGVEKMNLLPTPQMTHVLACSSYWPTEGSKGMSFPMPVPGAPRAPQLPANPGASPAGEGAGGAAAGRGSAAAAGRDGSGRGGAPAAGGGGAAKPGVPGSG